MQLKSKIKKIGIKNIIPSIIILVEMGVLYIAFSFLYHKIQDGPIRTLMLVVNSFNYSCFFVAFICLIVMLIFYMVSKVFHFNTTSIRMKIWKKFYKIVFVLAILFLTISWLNNDNLRVKNYDVQINKSSNKSDLKIAMMADMHTGAGTRENILNKIKTIINNEKPDCILLVGDIFDHTTSESDLKKFNDIFSSFDCPIYSVNGNHEDDCFFDYMKIYNDIGVNVVDNKVAFFDDIAIIGKDEDNSISVHDIINDNHIEKNTPKILIKHRPNGFMSFQEDIDLVCSGHIHGPRYPFAKWIYNIKYDLSYGMKKFNDMVAIVTSGVSVWGHHIRMVSHSEVVIVDINFSGT